MFYERSKARYCGENESINGDASKLMKAAGEERIAYQLGLLRRKKNKENPSRSLSFEMKTPNTECELSLPSRGCSVYSTATSFTFLILALVSTR